MEKYTRNQFVDALTTLSSLGKVEVLTQLQELAQDTGESELVDNHFNLANAECESRGLTALEQMRKDAEWADRTRQTLEILENEEDSLTELEQARKRAPTRRIAEKLFYGSIIQGRAPQQQAEIRKLLEILRPNFSQKSKISPSEARKRLSKYGITLPSPSLEGGKINLLSKKWDAERQTAKITARFQRAQVKSATEVARSYLESIPRQNIIADNGLKPPKKGLAPQKTFEKTRPKKRLH